MILPIVAYGSPILRKICADITPEYAGLEKLLADMWETIGKNGVESVIELDLTADEMALLHESAGHVREVMSAYDKMGLS